MYLLDGHARNLMLRLFADGQCQVVPLFLRFREISSSADKSIPLKSQSSLGAAMGPMHWDRAENQFITCDRVYKPSPYRGAVRVLSARNSYLPQTVGNPAQGTAPAVRILCTPPGSVGLTSVHNHAMTTWEASDPRLTHSVPGRSPSRARGFCDVARTDSFFMGYSSLFLIKKALS
ncbi:hypothetical protein BD413DRAFT_28764 [Trametes elegans]|nr:hypothetical protein BD413DRAFT_28764 [Trametes elegans]